MVQNVITIPCYEDIFRSNYDSSFIGDCRAQDNEEIEFKPIQEFIDIIESENMNYVKENVIYPLDRMYPLPSIANEKEFVEHFDSMFDEGLIKKIVDSDQKEDWEQGGRYIYLKGGSVFLSFSGKLRRLSDPSETDELERKKLIEQERSTLHESIRVYTDPEVLMNTANYIIRIDKLGYFYVRLSIWEQGQEMSSEPLAVKERGDSGSTGKGRIYKFVSADKVYRVLIDYGSNNAGQSGNFTVTIGPTDVVDEVAETIAY